MTERTPFPASQSPADRRILDFARSEVFERTFREGMALVEETAAYLDGPGRAASKRLDRLGQLAYAGESMRLTTRLMQLASWLLVQRAVRETEMSLSDARSEKYRFSDRDAFAQRTQAAEENLPEDLCALMDRSASLYERVKRLDENMYGAGAVEAAAAVNPVSDQLARLQAAFNPLG